MLNLHRDLEFGRSSLLLNGVHIENVGRSGHFYGHKNDHLGVNRNSYFSFEGVKSPNYEL